MYKKLSKLALTILVMVALLVPAPCLLAKTTATTNGFDQFGYNYKARLFNGWYGYYDKSIDGGYVLGSGDAKLVMKWSKDWTPMADEPVGAWTTNHWTWYSNDFDQGTWYGWDSRVAWNETTAPDGALYRMHEFLKLMKVSDNYDQWLQYENDGAYDAGWGDYTDGVPKYVVFQDVIEVYDTSTGALLATYEICTGSPKGLGHPIF